MYINRDFLQPFLDAIGLEVAMLWGARQVGKTTLLDQLELPTRLFLDDLALRQRALNDPGLLLQDIKLPCFIDEVQYAPPIFSELKRRIDAKRRQQVKHGGAKKTEYYLTGSNRLLLDKNIKESLAGRCHLFTLHGLSVREIIAHDSALSLQTLMFRGAWPDLYVTPTLGVQRYLNDYILTFIEKDIARTQGVEKINEFQTVLRLLAARTGQFLNMAEVAGAAGVDQKTVASWTEMLERNLILKLVPAFASNLSKRITKMKKLHFYDTGLCARLQGHQNETSLWNAPQCGSLFESLVFGELVKTRDNFLRDWMFFTWRTKDQHEIDFVVQGAQTVLIEAKLAIHGAQPFSLDGEAKKVFGQHVHKIVVTAGGDVTRLDGTTYQVPIQGLGDYLLDL